VCADKVGRVSYDVMLVQSVWEALQQIPYGETTTYSDIAQRINRPAARRCAPHSPRFTMMAAPGLPSAGALDHRQRGGSRERQEPHLHLRAVPPSNRVRG
jgi:hypothetical protein